MKTSEKIKSARKRKGLTQKQLAEIVGAATATINKIEADDTKDTSIKNTSFNLAVKIATALECNVFELFGDETFENGFPKVSNKETDRLKVLAFHSLDKYFSNQIFLKQFEFEQDTPENDRKFDEYIFLLQELKKGIIEKLIEVGFCTQEEFKEYKEYVLKQHLEKIRGKDTQTL